MKVLVTGATGFVGSNLVPDLLEHGYEVRALTRDRSKGEKRLDDRVEVVEGDVLDPETLDGVFEDIDVAYYLVHSLGIGGEFEERDNQAAANFATAASEAGVDRVIYLGGLGETGPDLSPHLRSRREVETLLREGEYDLTSFRAAIIVGAGSASFEMVRQMVSRLPVMITPKWVRTPSQPIAIADVIEYLRRAIEIPETAGETLEIGGPEVLSYQEMMERTAAALGRRLYVIPVPVLTPKLSVYWIDLVTDTPKHISHPLIEGLKNPVVVTDDRAEELIPMELTPFDEALRRAIETE
ncbi:NAD(P)H-binding protein [Halodesulfurarchaeum sp. HSR-GB]|uniref:NAD(P)H-binding protein n=1 Tax=Halodesulfurarchaeum sp. HSR-GB TaxID=3074077 RepID=UPI002854997B|nr:NAD(P)H-binding protein [Halodesulfurarchaeum sp. HSR-GB]MDR5656470.1 NAD(P)H-binding protein [Halodesulfurarchaeum sp. HSR-GB]